MVAASWPAGLTSPHVAHLDDLIVEMYAEHFDDLIVEMYAE